MTTIQQTALTPGGAVQPTNALTIAAVNQIWTLNVISFSSPISATMTSAQTRYMAVHYPIKMGQPDLQLDVQFASEADYDGFQKFVRLHQQQVLTSPTTANLVTVNWPARNIASWLGVIKKFEAGGERFNFAPKASFVVNTMTNMVASSLVPLADASYVPPYSTVWGDGMGLDAVLAAPTAEENAISQFLNSSIGTTNLPNPFPVNPLGAPTSPNIPPIAPLDTGGS